MDQFTPDISRFSLRFSAESTIAGIPEADRANTVCLGFAGALLPNRISQKYPGSTASSVTALLAAQPALVSQPVAPAVLMHTVGGLVTLDIATAACVVALPALGAEPGLITYVDEIERGVTHPPFEHSLYAFFAALQRQMQAGGTTDLQTVNQRIVHRYATVLGALYRHSLLHEVGCCRTSFQAAGNLMDLTPERIAFKEEQERYLQDLLRSECCEFDLPLKGQPGLNPERIRVNGACYTAPRSSLCKFFSRHPCTLPDGTSAVHPFMYVHHPGVTGASGAHIISLPPDSDCTLRGLSDLLDEMEDVAVAQRGGAPRSRTNPRPGFAYDDPWYTDSHSGLYSIIDTPRSGSLLSRSDIQEALWWFGSPLASMVTDHASLSLFIPAWNDSPTTPLPAVWQPTEAFPAAARRQFLPYVANQFSHTHTGVTSYRCAQEVTPALALPEMHDAECGAAFIRARAHQEVVRIVKAAGTVVFFHQYPWGLCFYEIQCSLAERGNHPVSLLQLAWCNHLLTHAAFQQLAPGVPTVSTAHLLYPPQHFSTVTASTLTYHGGRLRNERAIAGGLNLLCETHEPLYRNLPLDAQLLSDRTVRDPASKRWFFTSPSCLFSLDDDSTSTDHASAHHLGRIVFQMSLSQRFTLARSRVDIIRAEEDWRARKKLTFLSWIGTWFRRNRPADIGDVRSALLHLVTASWFNVISGNTIPQKIFEQLRTVMKIEELYDEVQDRCRDLDEYLEKRENATQSAIFSIFTFVLSPLSLVAGLTNGGQFSDLKNPNPFTQPFNFTGDHNGWSVFAVYLGIAGMLFGLVWLMYSYRKDRK